MWTAHCIGENVGEEDSRELQTDLWRGKLSHIYEN